MCLFKLMFTFSEYFFLFIRSYVYIISYDFISYKRIQKKSFLLNSLFFRSFYPFIVLQFERQYRRMMSSGFFSFSSFCLVFEPYYYYFVSASFVCRYVCVSYCKRKLSRTFDILVDILCSNQTLLK
jgi:hypothetical protein